MSYMIEYIKVFNYNWYCESMKMRILDRLLIVLMGQSEKVLQRWNEQQKLLEERKREVVLGYADKGMVDQLCRGYLRSYNCL